MINSSDISRIRTLLDSYYDGSISPVERKELTELFIAAESLPEDLTMEKEIYLSIESHEEIPVPGYLSERIEQALSAEAVRKRSFLWPALCYAGAAAAVIMLFAMAWNAVDISGDSIEVPKDPPPVIADHTSVKTIEDPSVQLPETESVKQIAAASSLSPCHTSVPAPQTGGNARVITDPDEAAHILDCVMSILTENMYTAERACDKPEIIIESMNHTLSKTEL